MAQRRAFMRPLLFATVRRQRSSAGSGWPARGGAGGRLRTAGGAARRNHRDRRDLRAADTGRVSHDVSAMSMNRWPSSERPREKLLRLGPAALSEAELLAILLQTGTRGRSAIDIARDMLG